MVAEAARELGIHQNRRGPCLLQKFMSWEFLLQFHALRKIRLRLIIHSMLLPADTKQTWRMFRHSTGSWPMIFQLTLLRRYIAVFVVSFAVRTGIVFGQNPNSGLSPPTQDTMDYFSTAIGLWESSSNFRGHFEISLFTANSLADAVGGKFVSRLEIQRGFLAKDGYDVRLQVDDIGGPRLEDDGVGGVQRWKGTPRDCLVSETLEANWFPRAEAVSSRGKKLAQGMQAVVQPRDPAHCGFIGPPESARDVLSPISMFGHPLRHILSASGPFAASIGVDSHFYDANIKVDPVTRACRLEWATPESYIQLLCQVSFAESVPVVQRIDYRSGGKYERDPNATLIRYDCRDFRSCNGVLVPAQIVQMIDSPHADGVTGRIFESKDLGLESAKNEDFQIRIPQEARIHGLKEWPPVIDGKRLIDLRTLEPNDVLNRGEVQEYTGAEAIRTTPEIHVDKPSPRRWWFMSFNFVVVAFVLGCVYFAKRFRQVKQ